MDTRGVLHRPYDLRQNEFAKLSTSEGKLAILAILVITRKPTFPEPQQNMQRPLWNQTRQMMEASILSFYFSY